MAAAGEVSTGNEETLIWKAELEGNRLHPPRVLLPVMAKVMVVVPVAPVLSVAMNSVV
jgi:hypothetical protein